MEPVDFSSKHDILIRHLDGTLTPMDVPYYEVNKLNEATWQIMSSGDYHYLLAGEDTGAAIDTGYGAGNLREFLEGLCGKPVPFVINTHSHFDHTANNCYFDAAYMSAEAVPLASVPYPSFAGIPFPKDGYRKIAVRDGEMIPLKGRELLVLSDGDHTRDGIALLDLSYRMLFIGDEMMPGMKRLNGSVGKWKSDLEKLLSHEDEFDVIFGGPGETTKEQLHVFYEAACLILSGKAKERPMEKEAKPVPELDGAGHLIYDCKRPHPEDVPKHEAFEDNPNMVTFSYKGCEFTYDRTNL